MNLSIRHPIEPDFWLALVKVKLTDGDPVQIVQRHVQRLLDDGALPNISTIYSVTADAIEAGVLDCIEGALYARPTQLARAVVAAVDRIRSIGRAA